MDWELSGWVIAFLMLLVAAWQGLANYHQKEKSNKLQKKANKLQTKLAKEKDEADDLRAVLKAEIDKDLQNQLIKAQQDLGDLHKQAQRENLRHQAWIEVAKPVHAIFTELALSGLDSLLIPPSTETKQKIAWFGQTAPKEFHTKFEAAYNAFLSAQAALDEYMHEHPTIAVGGVPVGDVQKRAQLIADSQEAAGDIAKLIAASASSQQ